MIAPETMARVVAEITTSPPTIIVHPEDAEAIRAAVEPIDTNPVIEVTELQEPGAVTIFVGRKVPILDLGSV